MRIIKRKTLKEFWEKHRNAEQALEAWFNEAKHAEWTCFDDIKKMYSSADVLPDNRVVFNIKGNTYRLVVKIHYNTQTVFLRFIGTHAQYNKIDAETI